MTEAKWARDARYLSGIGAAACSELLRARELHPDNLVSVVALGEEYGEFIKALLDEPRVNVEKEAIQMIAMVFRILTEGDPGVDEWRKRKGLDKLV